MLPQLIEASQCDGYDALLSNSASKTDISDAYNFEQRARDEMNRQPL